MAVRLAESLVDKHRFDIQDIMNRYIDWWQEGAFDTGPTAARVFELIVSGISCKEATVQVHKEFRGMTAGCNPAHRTPPLAMAAFLSNEELSNLTVQESSLTHWDSLAGDVAAASVVLCRSLILGAEWVSALQNAGEGRDARIRAALQDAPMDLLKNGSFSPDVLQAAIHFVNKNQNFDRALYESIVFAGPLNYCPVLVGAIAGARWGLSAIPENEMSHCSILPRVRNVADKLAIEWD